MKERWCTTSTPHCPGFEGCSVSSLLQRATNCCIDVLLGRLVASAAAFPGGAYVHVRVGAQVDDDVHRPRLLITALAPCTRETVEVHCCTGVRASLTCSASASRSWCHGRCSSCGREGGPCDDALQVSVFTGARCRRLRATLHRVAGGSEGEDQQVLHHIPAKRSSRLASGADWRMC